MLKPKFPKHRRNKNKRIYNLRTKKTIFDAFVFYSREGEGIGIPPEHIDKVSPGDVIECRGSVRAWYPSGNGTEMKRFIKVRQVERYEYFDGIKGPFVFVMLQGDLLDNLKVITEVAALRAKNKRNHKHVSI